MEFLLDFKQPVKEFVDLRLYTYKQGQWYEVRQRPSPEEHVPKPPREVFSDGDVTALEHIIHGTPQPLPFIIRYEYPKEEDGGGIFVHYLDFKYPRKGFPFPEAAQANNIAKRLLIGQIRWLAKNHLALISLLWKSNLNKWLREVSSSANVTLDRFHLQDFRYQKCCREIRKFIEEFLKGIGISMGPSSEFAKVIATMLENDDAYTTIIKDLASETSKKTLIKNPTKELDRLFKLFKERDSRPKMHETIGGPIKILRLAFLYPKFKRAFISALEKINFENLQMDDGDRYWALTWMTYNAMGLSFDERRKKFMEIHGGVHPRMTILKHDGDELPIDPIEEKPKENGDTKSN